MNSKKLLNDGLWYGFLVWFIGYVLGIVIFMFLPTITIGYILTPIGIVITLWFLIKKIKGDSIKYYFAISIIWTLIAVVFDYLFLVKLFGTSDYYKPDVYLYYALTFVLPLIVGMVKLKRNK